MVQVNMHEAKSRLSELGAMLAGGSEDEVVIARNNVPYLSLKAYVPERGGKPVAIGLFDGKYELPDDFDEMFDALDAEIIDSIEVLR